MNTYFSLSLNSFLFLFSFFLFSFFAEQSKVLIFFFFHFFCRCIHFWSNFFPHFFCGSKIDALHSTIIWILYIFWLIVEHFHLTTPSRHKCKLTMRKVNNRRVAIISLMWRKTDFRRNAMAWCYAMMITAAFETRPHCTLSCSRRCFDTSTVRGLRRRTYLFKILVTHN